MGREDSTDRGGEASPSLLVLLGLVSAVVALAQPVAELGILIDALLERRVLAAFQQRTGLGITTRPMALVLAFLFLGCEA